jgi:predicted transposase YdaD
MSHASVPLLLSAVRVLEYRLGSSRIPLFLCRLFLETIKETHSLLKMDSAVTTKPYDPTLKALVEIEPESWPSLLGRPTGPTEVIDADIATVSGAADKVLRVSADPAYLLHLEFVSGHDAPALPRKLHVRNALLEDRHELPVRSGVLVLRPDADSPQLTGAYSRTFPGEEPYLTFRYQVMRVWQLPPEPLLTGGLALLSLAPISAVTEADLPGIIQRMEQRLSQRRARKQAPLVWASAYILLGLRYSPVLAAQLFRGVVSMKESTTYQAILDEGRGEGAIAEARKLLRLRGEEAFGPADTRIIVAIEQLNDLTQLEELFKRVSSMRSWQELFGQPANGPRQRRRRSSR